ncbi:MAG TPA: cytochrome c3 family protein [Steroidobacteraceae bacterium]|jgi:hypothetical protein|nr:cytochrome c3 family protein [Steroidobacteraceae bacterium]
MAAIFGPAANLASKVVLLAVAGAVCVGFLFWWFWPTSDYARHVGAMVVQPVPFSHRHHVAGLGIDCRFCHSSVEVSANAGMPPTFTCMTCHSQIWTNASLLAPVRHSLSANTPIAWRRVTDLPDYVYFNHSIHIAKGVGCQSCHGPVEAMPLTYKAKALSMEFCLDCHRNPGPKLRPRSALYDTEWRSTPATPGAAALLAAYHVPDRNLTDCSLCHR